MKNVIADKIKEIRKNSGMGQRDFGFALGVSTSAVSSYERGERTPTLENLQKIAEIGGTTVDWLVSRSNTDNFNARASDPRLETAVREMEGEWRRSGEPASDFEMRIVGMLRRLPPQVRQIFMDRITTAYFDQMEQEIKKKDI